MSITTKISIVVITKNEQEHIQDCLRSCAFADEIVVVDSGSTDDTVAIATKNGARVIHRAFKGDYADQKNFALSQAQNDWIVSLDADERISGVLKHEIVNITQKSRDTDDAYAIKRNSYLFGKRFRWSGTQKDYPIRLFKKNKVFFEQMIHEKVVVEGSTGKIKEPIWHYSTNSTKVYVDKLNRYTDLEAKLKRESSRAGANPCRNALLRFLKIYLFDFGILDGFEGFQYAVLSGWYEFIKRVKVWEANQIDSQVV